MKRMNRQRARKAARRLTLRTAAVIALLVMTIGVAGFWGTSEANSSSRGEYHYIVVQEGETLWKIAQDTGINEDIRDVVIRIQQLNNLNQSVIHPGQRLLVPSEV